jgi:hypothetical protein
MQSLIIWFNLSDTMVQLKPPGIPLRYNENGIENPFRLSGILPRSLPLVLDSDTERSLSRRGPQ